MVLVAITGPMLLTVLVIACIEGFGELRNAETPQQRRGRREAWRANVAKVRREAAMTPDERAAARNAEDCAEWDAKRRVRGASRLISAVAPDAALHQPAGVLGLSSA